MNYLITGGSGYFGGLLKRELLKDGHTCVNVDIDKDADTHPNLTSLICDISQQEALENVFKQHGPFDCVFHTAAQLQLNRKNKALFFDTNLNATKDLADNCIKYGTKQFIFISSNCVYGRIDDINIPENHELKPFEAYGDTKVKSENILLSYSDRLNTTILRPPTIIGEGRLGILSIVFDFIRENKKIWLIGSGNNRYQFIYANDLVNACKLAACYPKTKVFNIGCDNVPSLNDLFQGVIDLANSKSKIYHLPRFPFIPAMKMCYQLGISPLGPYQYNMIANNFIGDTTNIKNELNWRPTKSNIEMLADNYRYYTSNYDALHNSTELTGHRKAGKAGIINLVKLFS